MNLPIQFFKNPYIPIRLFSFWGWGEKHNGRESKKNSRQEKSEALAKEKEKKI